MRFLLILLLSSLLPVLAIADHHRGHAINRADLTLYRLKLAVTAAENYGECASLTEYEQGRLGIVTAYTKAAISRVSIAKAALIDDSMELQDIRRLVTQPNVKENGLRAEPSAAIRINWVVSVLSNDLYPGQVCSYDWWKPINVHLGLASYELTELIWHITDAILEEQFGQP